MPFGDKQDMSWYSHIITSSVQDTHHLSSQLSVSGISGCSLSQR